jgi:hypothetical protein
MLEVCIVHEDVFEDMCEEGEFSHVEEESLVDTCLHHEYEGLVCYSSIEVSNMLAAGLQNRDKMTGSQFRAWLQSKMESKHERRSEVDRYEQWSHVFQILEMNQINAKKEAEHQARMKQIRYYCSVNPCRPALIGAA